MTNTPNIPDYHHVTPTGDVVADDPGDRPDYLVADDHHAYGGRCGTAFVADDDGHAFVVSIAADGTDIRTRRVSSVDGRTVCHTVIRYDGDLRNDPAYADYHRSHCAGLLDRNIAPTHGAILGIGTVYHVDPDPHPDGRPNWTIGVVSGPGGHRVGYASTFRDAWAIVVALTTAEIRAEMT